MEPRARVYLIGAISPEPEQLTVRSRDLLASADVVVYDQPLMELVEQVGGRASVLIAVEPPGEQTTPVQREFLTGLAREARAGKRAVRLYAGDPLLLPHGVSEARQLWEEGVEFEILSPPGGLGAIAAAAGVPFLWTGRGLAYLPVNVLEHSIPGGWTASLPLACQVPGGRLAEVGDRLVLCGWAPETPVLVIAHLGQPNQRCIETVLERLSVVATDALGLCSLVLGRADSQRKALDWFSRLPLRGRRIVITRAPEQASDLRQQLRELGAEVLEVPAIEPRPLEDYSRLDAAIARLDSYDWIVFTSANGVRFFVDRLDRSQRDWRAVRARLCAIGPATRRALEELHLKVDLMPQEFVAEAIVETFRQLGVSGKRILLPRAAEAREILPRELTALGATVDVVPAYRTVMPEDLPKRAARALALQPDWILFTSASTVKNFVRAVGAEPLQRLKVATIGPITSRTVRELGGNVTVEASEYTTQGLITALLRAESSDCRPGEPATHQM